MKTRLLTVLPLLLVLCFPLLSQGQCLDGSCGVQASVSQEIPSCLARIRVESSTYVSGGTGTLIDTNDTQGLIITNAHLFENGSFVQRIVVELPEGPFEGHLIDLDEEWDLALIGIAKPQSLPIRIADVPAKAGDIVWCYGLGPRGNSYRASSGRVRGYVANQAGKSRQTLQVSVGSRDGDSGGPMTNQRGELVGVLWGTDGSVTVGTYSGRVKLCVDRFLVPWNAEAAIAETESQAAREQALLALIQRNQVGTDPALLSRISVLENQVGMIVEQAQKFLGSQPPVALPSASPSLPVIPPSLPTPSVEDSPTSYVKPPPIALPQTQSKWIDFAWDMLAKALWWIPGIGIAIWLGRKFGVTGMVAGAGARGVDQITDWFPGTWDDKLLDPLAYKVAKYMGAKIPTPATEEKKD